MSQHEYQQFRHPHKQEARESVDEVANDVLHEGYTAHCFPQSKGQCASVYLFLAASLPCRLEDDVSVQSECNPNLDANLFLEYSTPVLMLRTPILSLKTVNHPHFKQLCSIS